MLRLPLRACLSILAVFASPAAVSLRDAKPRYMLSPENRAAAFLILALLAPVVWAAVGIAQSKYKPIHAVLLCLGNLFVRLQWRADIRGAMPLEPGKGAVIIANHRSSVDPFFIQVACGRVCHWFVAKEYFDSPLFGWFLRAAECIPTKRSGQDTAAMKQAIRYLRKGELVGLLPEGRINLGDELLKPLRAGAVMLALQGRAPVIPCYIEGAPFNLHAWTPFFMSARVKVQFGRPVDLMDLKSQQRDKNAMNEGILRCAREICRLAGQPDFPIRLAGPDFRPSEEQVARDHAEFRRRKHGRRK
jgi:1-acyl-sn-glycerol-3-phosphate acyltransferase